LCTFDIMQNNLLLLRFAPPAPVAPWEEELDVSGTATVKCSQYGYMTDGDRPVVSGSEDCLYLNVYVPGSAALYRSALHCTELYFTALHCTAGTSPTPRLRTAASRS
jgi:hypothetical protein